MLRETQDRLPLRHVVTRRPRQDVEDAAAGRLRFPGVSLSRVLHAPPPLILCLQTEPG